MRVLVIGGGGREHALIWKLSQSPQVDKIYCIPGNPGIAKLACCVELDTADNAALARFAQQHDIGLTVVGPELPLVNGISDYFANQGLAVFGPSRAAAQIEGSKTFAKDLMRKYGIPSARYAAFTSAEEAKAYIREQGAPIVVKADGLAAGKGVVVAFAVDEALEAVDSMMTERVFGDAGTVIVVEEFMEGEEASLLAFTDGYTVVPMVAAQDHKRIFDQVKEISTAIEQMATGSQQIVSSVNRMDNLSKQTAEESEIVSAATEEQSATMEEIASSSRSLAHLAADLREAVGKFRV